MLDVAIQLEQMIIDTDSDEEFEDDTAGDWQRDGEEEQSGSADDGGDDDGGDDDDEGRGAAAFRFSPSPASSPRRKRWFA